MKCPTPGHGELQDLEGRLYCAHQEHDGRPKTHSMGYLAATSPFPEVVQQRRYERAEGVFVGKPPCTCGAAFRLHQPKGYCPQEYRPETKDVAQRELARAEASGDEADIFVARGNLQRL